MRSARAAILRTRRLDLRPFSPDEAGELHSVFTDPDVRRYLLDDVVVPAEWVTDEIQRSTRRFAESGAGLWSVRLRGQRAVAGFAGFRPFFEPPELQLLYGLRRVHWGFGLATEACSEIVRHAFETLDFDEVRAAIDAPNMASRGVLERLGFQEWEGGGGGTADTEFFRLSGTRWRSGSASGGG